MMGRDFSRVGRVILSVPKGALIGLVLFYRWFLSPLKYAIFGPGARCRFEPSCSGYALEALRRHGFFCGTWLALRRLLRCHPWGASGPDPVPPRKVSKEFSWIVSR
jgi:putative membrane protein insertion efficiency factor